MNRKIMLIAEAQRYAFHLALILDTIQSEEDTYHHQSMTAEIHKLLKHIEQEVETIKP